MLAGYVNSKGSDLPVQTLINVISKYTFAQCNRKLADQRKAGGKSETLNKGRLSHKDTSCEAVARKSYLPINESFFHHNQQTVEKLFKFSFF